MSGWDGKLSSSSGSKIIAAAARIANYPGAPGEKREPGCVRLCDNGKTGGGGDGRWLAVNVGKKSDGPGRPSLLARCNLNVIAPCLLIIGRSLYVASNSENTKQLGLSRRTIACSSWAVPFL